MEYENIIYKVEDNLATITFNRPKALNALNSTLINEFSHALDEIIKNESIRVLILTGTGEKSFVAGADIKEITKLSPVQAKFFARHAQGIIGKLQQLAIPVISAVNGFALGGGCEIAIASDFIYASEKAKFGLPEINLGIIPGFGGTQRLPKLIGTNMAKEMIFTGKMIEAEEAMKIGLVNKICTPENLMADVIETANIISSKGKVSLCAAKQVINSGLLLEIDTGCSMEADAFALCVASEDAKEGMTAFIEKRKAVFKGSLKG